MKRCDLTVTGGISFITSNTGVNQGLSLRDSYKVHNILTDY